MAPVETRAAKASEGLAEMVTCVDGMPAGDGQKWQMMTVDARIQRRPGAKLGMDCVHVASSKVCGLLVKSIDDSGVVAQWNARSSEHSQIRPNDFIVKVDGVDGNDAGVAALSAALRAAGQVIDISVWGPRIVPCASVEEPPMSQFMQDRLQWLNEKTRMCTRREWETVFVPTLPPNNQNASASIRGECSVCKENIGMDQQVRGLACGHYFHMECVGEWFVSDRALNISCPLCRVPLEQQPSRWVSL